MKKKKKKLGSIADVIARRKSKLFTQEGYRSLLIRLIVIVVAGYLLLTQVFLITQATGMDMFPAVKDGDLMIAFRLQQDYVTDDVVVYVADGKQRCGRIVATEYDSVDLSDGGSLRVNGTTQGGEILYPSYAKEGIEYPYRTPVGCVFILGDYRTQATDSRDFEAIPLADVQGKVITILRRRGL